MKEEYVSTLFRTFSYGLAYLQFQFLYAKNRAQFSFELGLHYYLDSFGAFTKNTLKRSATM